MQAYEWAAGIIATLIAGGVTGIWRMSAVMLSLQSDLRHWTNIVEKSVARLESHETRLSSIEVRLQEHLLVAEKMEKIFYAHLKHDSHGIPDDR